MNRFLSSTLLGAAFSAILTMSGTASASSNYPDEVKATLALKNAPECALCHLNGITGIGTVNTPFGKKAREKGLKFGDTALLKSVLARMEGERTDSDGDGATDIAELKADTDPNLAAGGSAPETVAYGCGAHIGRSDSSGVLTVSAFALAALWIRRRRLNP